MIVLCGEGEGTYLHLALYLYRLIEFVFISHIVILIKCKLAMLTH